jgi:maltose alpha-D-glucosyltransferase/alpha-amylase
MQEVLPPYLARRRWFGAKGDRFHAARFAYAVQLPETPDIFFAEVDVEVGDRTERYALPAAIVWENTPLTPLAEQLSLARVRRGPRIGTLTDAFALEGFALSVLDAIRRRTVLESAAGLLHFNPEPQFEDIAIGRPSVRWLTAEQSNSSLVLGDASVLKLVRHISPGIHPEAEMTRYLTRAGFQNTALLEGEVVRIDKDGVPHTLLILQHFVHNQGDAWSWTLDFLRRTVEDAALTGGSAERFEQDLSGYVPLARAIGTRLGELHATLARPTDDPAFSPVMAQGEDVSALEQDLLGTLSRALALIAANKEWANEAESAAASFLVDSSGPLSDKARHLSAGLAGSLLTRIHGDLHLGQILVAQSDAYLIDFEGEPARSLAERRAKSSPLRDVAGILRSFDYAVATLRRTSHEAVPDANTIRARRDALLSQFADRAEEAFLAGYRDVLAATEFPWADSSAEAGLIDVYLLAKASYEIAYEAANRPGWIGLPTTGLANLARRLLNVAPAEGITPLSPPTNSPGDPDV